MREFTVEDMVVGIIAAIGVVVLIALFVYVVKQVIVRKD